MALREEFERSGNWLFRWRSFLPLPGLAILLLALLEYEHPGNSETADHLWEGFCLATSFLGLAIRMYTIGHTPKGTSGRNTAGQVADSLNTTGAYSLVRNPLYLGNYFMGLGVASFACLWWLALIYSLAFWLYYERIIFAEEEFLRKKFGAAYLRWSDRTPAFIPRMAHYEHPRLPFSWRKVLKREYSGFFAVIAALFVLETLGEFFARGRIEFDRGWTTALIVGFAVWLTLRTLKKRTNLLTVEGR